MAYDSNVTSSNLTIDVKRRTYQVTFMRPQTTGGGSLSGVSYVKQDGIDATEGSPTSGSVLASTNWLVSLTKEQILKLPNAGSFLNGLIAAIDDMKTEFDASGSVATGSVSQIL